MKYVFFLLVGAAVYWYLAHQAPVKEAVAAVKQEEVKELSTGPRAQPTSDAPAGNTSYGRAVNRTHDVLQQVKGRNGDGEF